MKILIVPTGGNQKGANDQLEPKISAQLRLRKAAETIDRQTIVVITGGYRKDSDKSEAEVAKRYLMSLMGEVSYVPMVHTVAKGLYTAQDMVATAPVILSMKLDSATIISHPLHAQMAIATLRACGIDDVAVVPSGEPCPYGPIERIVLRAIYRLDPKWERLVSLPLRWLANRRINSI